MAAPRRVADAIFRRDMLGPSFGNFATSVTLILLGEKVVMDLVMPSVAPFMEMLFLAYGKNTFLLVSSLLGFNLTFWFVGLLMAVPAIIDTKQWKIQPNRSLDMQKLLKSLPLIAFNGIFGALFAVPVLSFCLPESAFDFRRLPSMKSLVGQAVIWLVMEEICFYYCHRLFHESKALYSMIHKLHHTWTAPISVVAMYCHPLDHILSNVSPAIVGPVLCGSHVVAISTFVSLGIAHTCAVHSGYWICDDNGMHDEHHAKFTVNYGVFGTLDWLHGTLRLPAGAAGAGPDAKRG